MPKRTSGRITDFDEKTITEILESPDLGRKLSKILDGNVRLALTAQKLLYRKMIDSGGSLNATQLNMIVGTASDKVTAMLKQVEVLRVHKEEKQERVPTGLMRNLQRAIEIETRPVPEDDPELSELPS